MPLTAADLLRRYAEVRGLPAEDVRWLRYALRLSRRERSAALLRRVVAPVIAERDAARSVAASLAERVAKQSDLLSRKAERSGSTP